MNKQVSGYMQAVQAKSQKPIPCVRACARIYNFISVCTAYIKTTSSNVCRGRKHEGMKAHALHCLHCLHWGARTTNAAHA